LVAIDGIRSPFLYRDLAREAVIQLKYKRVKALAEPLGQLLASYLSLNPLPIDTLVPVPLHPKRMRERGYNQSFLIARELGQLADLPIMENSLVRLRNTAPQVRITGTEQRQLNVRGAFRCGDRSFQGRRVLVVDDVCTTGATLDACALALKEAGAASVWGLTLAREL
jgi:ComF family protein